jgi:antitoxin component of RelBE/YafQ-DinJ toxin-antitoxin module
MRNLCVRVDDATHEQVSQKAEEMAVSLSDFMRGALHAMCNNDACNPEPESEELKSTMEILHSQLHVKDMQLERYQGQLEAFQMQLGEQSKRHDTIVLQMTQQLDRANLQLEDLRQKQGWFKRLFGKDGESRRSV